MPLTSTHNSQLQKIRQAVANGRPTEEGLIVAEGPHLLQEAQRSAWSVEKIFYTAGALESHSRLVSQFEAETVEVSTRAFASIAGTEATQGILALMRPRTWTWRELAGSRALIIVLDGVQDPGNAGTIVRSAEAFGASGVVFAPGCARVSNGKLLRAAAGSIFRLPFLEWSSRGEIMEQFASAQLTLYGLAVQKGILLPEADLQQSCALVVGSEGAGLSAEFADKAEAVSIRTNRVESLNAAVACSIALFEAARQRNMQ